MLYRMSLGHQQSSFQLPQPRIPDGLLKYYHPFPPTSPTELRKRQSAQDLMKLKGTWVHESMYDPVYPDWSYMWFLCANRYSKTQVLSISDELEWSQTHPIIKFWSILQQARFAGEVNALLLDPNTKDKMYIFSGVLTVKIDTASGQCFLTCACIVVLTALILHRDSRWRQDHQRSKQDY